MNIIALSGKKQSGKDTAAAAFAKVLRERGLEVECVAFADALKDEVCMACGVTREFLDANKAAFRPALQWWGTEFRRNFHGDSYWVDRLYARVKASAADAVVVTDMRFRNELEWAARHGAVLVRVERPQAVADSHASDSHASETDLNGAAFHHTLRNTGTLAEFQEQCGRLAARLVCGVKAPWLRAVLDAAATANAARPHWAREP